MCHMVACEGVPAADRYMFLFHSDVTARDLHAQNQVQRARSERTPPPCFLRPLQILARFVCCHPLDGEVLVAAACKDFSVYLWSGTTGEPLGTFTPPSLGGRALAIGMHSVAVVHAWPEVATSQATPIGQWRCCWP
jgi:hypothetical protein